MVAASILPICMHNGKLHFLFGKENAMEQSAKGWSDFGGRKEDNESIYKAALREGAEELTGFLGDENKLRKTIRNNGGYFKISHNQYHVHLFCLPYDSSLVEHYNDNHQLIWDRMQNMSETQKKLINETRIFEKIELCWFSLDDMEARKGEFREFYQAIVDKFICQKKEIMKFLKSKGNRKSRRNTAKNR